MADRVNAEPDNATEEQDRSNWTPADYQAEIDRLMAAAAEADQTEALLSEEQRRRFPTRRGKLQLLDT